MIKLNEFINDLEMLYDENLSHYLDDEDLRLIDEWTHTMQKSEMKKLIFLLKSGASEEELQKISFLGYSS